MNESNPKSKKRLTMMPEVLPAPTVITSGSVRRRTLARLRVLAALGAAGLAASCGKVDDGGGGGIDPSLPDGGGKDGGEDAYGVVDPLPQPTCFNAQPTAQAHFTRESEIDDAGADPDAGADAGADGNHRLVTVDVSFNESGVVLGTAEPEDSTTHVVSIKTTTNSAELVLSVPIGATSAAVRVKASCLRGPDQLYLELTLTDDTVKVYVN